MPGTGCAPGWPPALWHLAEELFGPRGEVGGTFRLLDQLLEAHLASELLLWDLSDSLRILRPWQGHCGSPCHTAGCHPRKKRAALLVHLHQQRGLSLQPHGSPSLPRRPDKGGHLSPGVLGSREEGRRGVGAARTAACELLLVGSPELPGPCLIVCPLLGPTLPSPPSWCQPVCAEFPVAQRAAYPAEKNKSKRSVVPIYIRELLGP